MARKMLRANKSRLWAMLALLATACFWGGMFHVAKATLPVIDAFWLTLLRYGFTAPFFVTLLIWREGRTALSFEGRGVAAWWYGTLGFAVFNYFVYFGLTYSQPEHGAIIMALMPLIAALISWVADGQRPSGPALGLIALALSGVLLVITHGDPEVLLHGDTAFGDMFILVGAIAWVLYTRSVPRFNGWSSLRFTTLTTLAGTASIVLATGALTLSGAAHLPRLETLPEVAVNIVYIVVLATIAAVLFWNYGIHVLGPLNGMLFINLVPISAFIIGLARGFAPYPAEFAGAALTLLALVANNLLARRASALGNAERSK